MAINIAFEEHFFPHIQISANPKFDPKSKSSDAPVEIVIDSNIAIKKMDPDKLRYVSELRVKVDSSESPAAPYFMDIVCVCFLYVEGVTSDDEAKAAATRSAHDMLFPAIRELVLNLTARQPWGQFSIGQSTLGAATQQAAPAPTKKATGARKRRAE